jgi:hypothetical protein
MTSLQVAPTRPREISDAEHAAVHFHLPALVNAINATGDNRECHVGILMHALLLGLTQDERAVALAYLHAVLRFQSN